LSTSSNGGPGFFSCWWKATLIIFFAECLLGLLDSGLSGLTHGAVNGLFHAPVLGLFFGGLYWLIRR
jgi:hypothetical protein